MYLNYILEHLDLLAAFFELTGMWLVGSKKKSGFLFLIACNVTWFIYSTNKWIPGLFIVVSILFFINIRNFKNWGKNKHKEAEKTLSFWSRRYM